MKVAIITMAYSTQYGLNYGNRLQNYALQEILKSIEANPETIMQTNILGMKIYQQIIWGIKKSLYCLIKGEHFKLERKKGFDFFNSTYIVWANKKINYNIIPKDLNDEYDFFIVGSDQVWNTQPSDMKKRKDIYLLTFAEPNKRIAYAASFGISSISKECIESFNSELKRFKSISVRENEGVKLVEECGANASVVLDPTMMLTDKQWNIIARKPKFVNSDSFIVTYFLGDRSKEIDDYISLISKDKPIIHLYADFVQIDKIENIVSYTVSPEEFVWLFSKAEYVVTDSFHACAFSIIYHRPFRVFERLVDGEKSGMESRINTILKVFHLEQCRWNSSFQREIDTDYNWSNVEKILADERKKSLDFLKSALEE